MLHSQHFAYMPIEEVMKQFHATKVSVMEATRACPYAATGVHSDLRLDGVVAHSHPLRTQAFPKKIQEEMDRLADEQMLKLRE